MLALTSNNWKNLEDAYGNAQELPKLLNSLLDDDTNSHYWEYIWSRLCHQGTIYSATFAVFPYLVSALKTRLENNRADNNFYAFATCVEISRQIDEVEIPEEFKEEYFLSLQKFLQYQKRFLDVSNNYDDLSAVLAFNAAMKNQPQLADLLLNIREEEVKDVSEWYFSR